MITSNMKKINSFIYCINEIYFDNTMVQEPFEKLRDFESYLNCMKQLIDVKGLTETLVAVHDPLYFFGEVVGKDTVFDNEQIETRIDDCENSNAMCEYIVFSATGYDMKQHLYLFEDGTHPKNSYWCLRELKLNGDFPMEVIKKFSSKYVHNKLK